MYTSILCKKGSSLKSIESTFPLAVSWHDKACPCRRGLNNLDLKVLLALPLFHPFNKALPKAEVEC